jgi:MFS family permease
VPGVLAAVSILALVKETPHPVLGNTTFAGALRQLPSSFRRYVAGVLIFGCGDFSHTLLILYAVQSLTPLNPHGAAATAIALYTLHNLLYAVGAYPAGAMADRYGKGRFLIGAYMLAALMNVVLVFISPSLLTLIVVFVLAGAAYAAQQSLERAIAADLVPVEVRSTGFGVLATANGIGDLISSCIVGILWSAFSPTVAFAYSLIVTCIGAIATTLALRATAR